jgi:hypothetical protein
VICIGYLRKDQTVTHYESRVASLNLKWTDAESGDIVIHPICDVCNEAMRADYPDGRTPKPVTFRKKAGETEYVEEK